MADEKTYTPEQDASVMLLRFQDMTPEHRAKVWDYLSRKLPELYKAEAVIEAAKEMRRCAAVGNHAGQLGAIDLLDEGRRVHATDS